MNKENRVALYARVSTNNGQHPAMQIRELREYCKRRGWEIYDEYVDRGISGAKDSRQQLDRLMADVKRRYCDVVVVWKFDRFARSVSHLLRALETFDSLGVAFVSLSEQIDTSTPTGKMVLAFYGKVDGIKDAVLWLRDDLLANFLREFRNRLLFRVGRRSLLLR